MKKLKNIIEKLEAIRKGTMKILREDAEFFKSNPEVPFAFAFFAVLVLVNIVLKFKGII